MGAGLRSGPKSWQIGGMATKLRSITPEADPLDGMSLPGWLYYDPEFFAAEHKAFLRAAPQVVCHESEIAEPGEWRSLEYLGESVFVIRGDDGQVRAFSNVCRHRGSRLVDGTGGCAKVLTCPYHAWSYARDGRLVGVPHRSEYPGLRTEDHGLFPVALETWHGFLFVTLEAGAPSVAEMMVPYADEVALYRFEDLRVVGRVTLRPRPLNWKTIADNYSDHLHIPVGHPGLSRLFGRNYRIEAKDHVDQMEGDLIDKPSANPIERAYQHFLPAVDHLPASHQRKWLYYKLFPNVAFDIYPDQVDFMQFLPVSATETVIREISYALPDDAARDEGGALPQLADQPPRERRGHRTDHAGPAWHAVAKLCSGAAGDERSMPAELREEAQADDPGGAAGAAAGAWLAALELARRITSRSA